ncbi:MAG: hypothetical protein HY079_14295 [Elusimicrobia bacterium]|nr:hypothetical protein [Elusimicrobiota bacterium]
MRAVLAAAALALAACARPGPAPEAAATAASGVAAPAEVNRFAEQAYLEGVADFQRGNLASAADKFSRCLTMVTTGQTAGGCMAGLELTRGALTRGAETLGPAPAAANHPPLPRATSGAHDDAAASQSFLEGMIYFQKGDYETARKRWERCAELATPGTAGADDCRAGLTRLAQLYGGSTAPDGKK